MEYTKSEHVGGIRIEERFEGTPKEILEVLNGMRQQELPNYNLDDAIKFIRKKTGIFSPIIYQTLQAEEDYMRSVGIIKK